MKRKKPAMARWICLAAVALGAMLVLSAGTQAQQSRVPGISIGVNPGGSPGDVAITLQIIAVLTLLTLAPSILLMMTSFTRIIIVLSFIRGGMGTQQVPPNQVLIGLALFVTLFVMMPVMTQINDNAIGPYTRGAITQEEALRRAERPLRDFMIKQTREKDMAVFVDLARIGKPKTLDDIPTYVVIPSFVISELKTAFQMGFVIYIPFLVIDMLVSSTLMSMGMMMLPPVMISLPFKILLFVLVDGWGLVIKSLVESFVR